MNWPEKIETEDHPLIYGPNIDDLKKFGIKEEDSRIITKAHLMQKPY